MQLAAIVLAVAAVGGATLATIRLRGALRPPTWMALGHGAVAATGLVLLIHAAVTTGLPPPWKGRCRAEIAESSALLDFGAERCPILIAGQRPARGKTARAEE